MFPPFLLIPVDKQSRHSSTRSPHIFNWGRFCSFGDNRIYYILIRWCAENSVWWLETGERNENERKSKEWLRIRKERKKKKRISSFSNDETVAGVEFPFANRFRLFFGVLRADIRNTSRRQESFLARAINFLTVATAFNLQSVWQASETARSKGVSLEERKEPGPPFFFSSLPSIRHI